MKYLTENVGRGPKKVLKYIYVKDWDKNIVKTIYQRQEIEYKLISQNRIYYKKGFNTNTFKDKIYKYLLSNQVRDRILGGKLWKEDCTNENIFDFLSIL